MAKNDKGRRKVFYQPKFIRLDKTTMRKFAAVYNAID